MLSKTGQTQAKAFPTSNSTRLLTKSTRIWVFPYLIDKLNYSSFQVVQKLISGLELKIKDNKLSYLNAVNLARNNSIIDSTQQMNRHLDSIINTIS